MHNGMAFDVRRRKCYLILLLEFRIGEKNWISTEYAKELESAQYKFWKQILHSTKFVNLRIIANNSIEFSMSSINIS